MASKQALDGKYNLWFESEYSDPADGNILHDRSVVNVDLKFPELPDAKLYILKLEQFSLAGAAVGKFFVTEPVGVTQDFAPCALITVTGFSQLPGDSGLQGKGNRSRDGVILSRMSTNFGVFPARDNVTPDKTPGHLVLKPQDGIHGIQITGSDLSPLFTTDAGGTEEDIPPWVMCISLQPIPDQEADRYFGR